METWNGKYLQFPALFLSIFYLCIDVTQFQSFVLVATWGSRVIQFCPPNLPLVKNVYFLFVQPNSVFLLKPNIKSFLLGSTLIILPFSPPVVLIQRNCSLRKGYAPDIPF